ncbi:MbeB family mobilization protein [Cronobacter sakazakii]|uniref:MbeB family mobilization protein n=1 Tax=Cronobacter sakazakii TaxID=28141 RepID=UPI00294B7D27|nr:MbeB family mobilization protein [Cronobacter sakazakii]
MNSLLTLAKDLEQKSKAQQQTTGEMLKAAFSEHEKSVRAELSESEKRISAAILDHDRKLSSAMSQRTKGMLRMVSQTWLTIVLVSALLIASSAGILWWQGQQITDNYTHLRQQEDTLAKMTARTWGVRYQESSDGRRFLILPPGMQTEAIPYDGTTWIRLKQE